MKGQSPIAAAYAASGLQLLSFNFSTRGPVRRADACRSDASFCTLTLYILDDVAMKYVNVTELRQNLPAYLQRVRRGERIKVTSRGKVIAELTPPSADASQAAAARDVLRGSVIRYVKPLEPVIAPSEWDANR